MDHIRFAKSINANDLEYILKTFFDQVIALYNLVDSKFDLDISAETVNTTPSIRFIMLTNSVEEAEFAYSSLCNNIIKVYGHTYVAQLIKNDNSIYVELVEKASG